MFHKLTHPPKNVHRMNYKYQGPTSSFEYISEFACIMYISGFGLFVPLELSRIGMRRPVIDVHVLTSSPITRETFYPDPLPVALGTLIVVRYAPGLSSLPVNVHVFIKGNLLRIHFIELWYRRPQICLCFKDSPSTPRARRLSFDTAYLSLPC